ncbi:KR domain-containing protein [Trichoderma simmonsii]|uniref:KR domain-containing protein n=1 Tax=Trichoderma simmonsii TaxID=1491479 RepID=A0A8G0P809_9HYPO|nr:KR domain-containing protein [Trichoderma simmonsii]
MDRFNIPRNRTYQPHDTSFVEGATRETNGRGVNVALTSVFGELLQTTWRYIAQFGGSVEIGKRASDGPDDVYFVREIERRGCAVELVKVSVVNKEDVARGMQLATNLKGIFQTFMVLLDEAVSRMAYEDWNTATLPEVRVTWNLHDIACQASIQIAFFIRLSSRSSNTSLAGQSNYASTTTFLTLCSMRLLLGCVPRVSM